MGTNNRERSTSVPRASAAGTALVGLGAVVALALVIGTAIPLSGLYPFKAGALFAIVVAFAVFWVRDRHPFERFGAANQVTMARAALVALVAGLIGEAHLPAAAGLAVVLSALVSLMDGLDGWLARRSRLASAFGARFDMETDAVLIMALAILAWRYEKAGAWVVISGLLRYLFLAAGRLWPWLQRPLPPARRRQVICVVQIVSLILVLIPVVAPPFSTLVAAIALGSLCYSFLTDIIWLWGQGRRVRVEPPDTAGDGSSVTLRPTGVGLTPGSPGWRRWTLLAAALVLLNVSVTFDNIWPTPAVWWYGQLSVELAACILVLGAVARWFGPPTRAALGWLSAIWVVLVVGRYADVTAPALYGRQINLYWDLRYVPDVASMLIRAASVWVSLLVVAVAGLSLYLMFALARWALGRLSVATGDASVRRLLEAIAAVMMMLFVGQRLSDRLPLTFASPVVASFARQVPLVIGSMAASTALAPSPPMDADLALVRGTDVFLVFVESYGAICYDQPEFNRLLAPSRAELEGAVRDTGREVVSAFVESPTFGGGSWLAHLSLLSGIDVRDPDTYAQLMTQKRETLVTPFSRHGYRTIAMMPGIWQPWPEGAFYGFDTIYNGERLDYRGPHFGWWAIPDQFAIAQLDALEVSRTPRAPLFLFFPTVSTHTPFTPTPPYQPDWQRMLTATPFEVADVLHVWDEEPDWMNLGPSYVEAVSYLYRSLAGYVRLRAERDFVLIVIGDHQPPAAVTGLHARWDVPMHVIASRPAVLEHLRTRGFRSGVYPSGASIARMHAMLPVLLDAFGARE